MGWIYYIHGWIHATYATHHDTRGHTGGIISMVQGMIHEKSSKQQINTKKSTETELEQVIIYSGHCVQIYSYWSEDITSQEIFVIRTMKVL